MARAAGALSLLVAVLMAGCGGEVSAAPGALEMVGHYRLVNRMETASANRLHADGRFDYGLSVGGLDARRVGTWTLDPYSRLIELRVQGGEARIARALRVVGVQPLAEVAGTLPADHPARGAPQGVVVRIESSAGDEVASTLVSGFDAGRGEIQAVDLVEAQVRWNVFGTRPAALAAVGMPSSGLQLLVELDVPPPGSVVVLHSDYGQLVDDQGVPVLWQFQQAEDGSLVPVGAIDGRDAPRYVREADGRS